MALATSATTTAAAAAAAARPSSSMFLRIAQVLAILLLAGFGGAIWYGDTRVTSVSSAMTASLFQAPVDHSGGQHSSDSMEEVLPVVGGRATSNSAAGRGSIGARVVRIASESSETPTQPYGVALPRLRSRSPKQREASRASSQPKKRRRTSEMFPVNSPRMQWGPADCQPNSRYADADDATRQIFREIIAHSEGLRELHDSTHCFFFGRGVWNDTLDRAQFTKDVEAVRSGKAGHEWTCTMDHLSRQESLRMTFTASDPAVTKSHKATSFGGHPRRVRFAEVHHAECNLVNLRDPYALLVALGSLRGGGVATTYTVIEIMGDSIHRGMFNTIVGMLRGAGERVYFDRQAHRNLRYIVTTRGDVFMDGSLQAPEDTLLEMTYHAVFGYLYESIPPGLRLDSRGATVIVTGGLEHAEFDCGTRQGRVDALINYVGKATSHIRDGMKDSLHKFERNLFNDTLLQEIKDGAPFPQPSNEALIVFKAGIQPQSKTGDIVRGYHTMRNQLYKGAIDEVHMEKMRAIRSRRGVANRSDAFVATLHRYASATPGLLFLDEIKLLNWADEGPGKVDLVRLQYGPINVAGATGAGVANASSSLDPETTPSDGLHSTCTMHWSLPERVGGWYLQHSTCRGWRERGNIQLFASMILATARARHAAEHAALQHVINAAPSTPP